MNSPPWRKSDALAPSDEVLLQSGPCPFIKTTNTDLSHSQLTDQNKHGNLQRSMDGTSWGSENHNDDDESDTEYRSESDEADRLLQNEPTKPRKISQKKTVEQANFRKWLSRNRPNLSKRSAKRPNAQESLQYMVKSCEGGEKIINSPRDYQIELFERAKRENTIAVLDTGSGKTLIAVLLLDHTINQELEDRAKGLPRRISFFLVDKVALAFQQHAVLECNLAHSVAVFFGDGVRDSWNPNFWDEQFQKHEVIVCTAEILNQCLQRAFFRMDQINLLIFDEAHHTKKDHSYARIIKDHYAVEDRRDNRLPRIFGMTASPVDAQVDVRQAATELEGILHSRIATTADPNALRRTVGKPRAEVLHTYSHLPPRFDTALTSKLKPLVSNNKLFSKAFSFSEIACRELGAWFVDRMWQLCLEDDEFLKLEARTERNFTRDMASDEVVEKQMSRVKAAREVIQTHHFTAPTDHNMSSKVHELLRLLGDHFKRPNIRCIVFVRQRWSAKLLSDLFQQEEGPKIPSMKTGFLMGANTDDGSSPTSFRVQLKTIIDFKKADLNCIFATSVAEEGLDIPDCNLIVRFDLCKTMIQYIQSRGRARQEDSIYIHMLEQGNGEHRRIVYQNATSERLLRKFCNTQPEDRLLTGSDYNMDYFLRKERNQRQYTIKSTGAKLTYKNSLSVLGDFVNSLRNQDDFVEGMGLAADFTVTPAQGGFICEVFMPPLSPISNAVGKIHSTKQVAKCSAAFEACFRLLDMKFLDANLRSKFVERRHAFANARLAVSSKKKAKYDMRIKPQIWAELGEPERLHATILLLANPNALHQPSRPLLVLTRIPLPQIKPFPMFFGPDEHGTSDAMCQVLSNPIEVTEAELHIFTRFTLKVFLDIFAKRYVAGPKDLPYFLVPTNRRHDFDFSTTSDLRNIIDWSLLNNVLQKDAETYTGEEPDDFFKDKYIVDPHDGSRRFWLRGVRRDLSCHNPVPTDVKYQPTYRQWKRGEVAHNILNWSVSSWKATREAKEKTWSEKQPVAVGFYASLRRNFLADIKEDQKNPRCYFILEPMRISPIASDVVAMATLFPSIIHRIEQNLIALDACRTLKLDIHPDLALEALTKDSDNQGEDDGKQSLESFEPVDFQPGMGANYERLEFLGDSFLKMATTISIFTLIPNKDEFDYHCERMVMICNQNLFGVALRDNFKLQEYIRSKSFERGAWYPVLKLEHGKTHLKTLKQMDEHRLADKSIADVCEALIGAAYMTTRKNNDYNLAIQAVTRLVNHKRHPMMKWEDYYAAYIMPEWQTAPVNAAERDMAQKIEEATAYKFKHPRGLRSAFRHPSRPFEFDKVPTYQRLEFLGDALLDMVCVDYLFHIAPDKGPQWLTEHKMAMVSNQFLGCLAVSLGFHKHLLHNHPALGAQILEYVTEITEARRAAEDAAEVAGKPRSEYARDYWIEVRQPPKCIPDVLEAYIGAMFVDSEYNFSTVQRFFQANVVPYFSDMHMYDTFANKHPVTFCTQYIYEIFGCHAYGLHSEEIHVEDDAGTLTGQVQVVAGILIHGIVVDGAVRESGRYAKTAAAKKALDKLQGMTKEAFVEEFRCDCKPGEEAEDIGESATAI